MILDITAGNRHIWNGWMPPMEDDGTIIFCDIETRLRIPPDIICDNRKLPIRDGIADIVIYDPPHWNFGSSKIYGDPQEKIGSWWGNFGNLGKLMRLLAGGVKAIRRVLKPQGMLYFKWSTGRVSLRRIIVLFLRDFVELERSSRPSRAGRNKGSETVWITYKKASTEIVEPPSIPIPILQEVVS